MSEDRLIKKHTKVYCEFCKRYYDVPLSDFMNLETFLALGWKTVTYNYDKTYYICPKHKINNIRDIL